MLYNLDINFLNDRDPSNLPPGGSNGPDDKGKPKAPIETKVPLMVGGAVMVILPLAALGYLLLLGQQQAKIKAEIQELDAKISTLESQNERIKNM